MAAPIDPTRPVRWGVLGRGPDRRHGGRRDRRLAATASWSRSAHVTADRAAEFARTLGIPRSYGSYAGAGRRPRPRRDLHRDHARSAPRARPAVPARRQGSPGGEGVHPQRPAGAGGRGRGSQPRSVLHGGDVDAAQPDAPAGRRDRRQRPDRRRHERAGRPLAPLRVRPEPPAVRPGGRRWRPARSRCLPAHVRLVGAGSAGLRDRRWDSSHRPAPTWSRPCSCRTRRARSPRSTRVPRASARTPGSCSAPEGGSGSSRGSIDRRTLTVWTSEGEETIRGRRRATGTAWRWPRSSAAFGPA